MWIARNKGKNGQLNLFGSRPSAIKGKCFFGSDPIFEGRNTFGMYWPDREGAFKDLTFEDGPQEVELIIKR